MHPPAIRPGTIRFADDEPLDRLHLSFVHKSKEAGDGAVRLRC
jgi:hypothetical protein